MSAFVWFSESKASHFRNAYKKAVSDGAETFEFEGSTVFTDYAKYILEYYESVKK